MFFAAGCAVGYYVSKLKFEERFVEEIEVERVALRALVEQELLDAEEVEEYDDEEDGEEEETEERSSLPQTRRLGHVAYNEIRKTIKKRPGGEEAVKALDSYQTVEEVSETTEYVTTTTYREILNERDRDKTKPYVVAEEEFTETIPGFGTVSYTYYADSDTLVGERGEMIDNINEVVGRDNLDLFGYMSEDDRVLYIRNESISLDIEVEFDPGSYGGEA